MYIIFMKGLPTLIRLQKRTIDELKKRQSVLLERREFLVQRSQELSDKLELEVKLAAELADMRGFFGNYSEHIKKQRKEIANEVYNVDMRINALTDEIALAFGELKKYEIAEENRKKRAKQKENKREQDMFDDIAARRKTYI